MTIDNNNHSLSDQQGFFLSNQGSSLSDQNITKEEQVHDNDLLKIDAPAIISAIGVTKEDMISLDGTAKPKTSTSNKPLKKRAVRRVSNKKTSGSWVKKIITIGVGMLLGSALISIKRERDRVLNAVGDFSYLPTTGHTECISPLGTPFRCNEHQEVSTLNTVYEENKQAFLNSLDFYGPHWEELQVAFFSGERDVCLKLIQTYPLHDEKYPSYYDDEHPLNNEKFPLNNIESLIALLQKHFSSNFQYMEDVILSLIERLPETTAKKFFDAFKPILHSWKNNQNVAVAASKKWIGYLDLFSTDFRKDPQFLKRIISVNPDVIDYVEKDLRNDAEFMKIFMFFHANHFEKLGPKLRNDETFALGVIPYFSNFKDLKGFLGEKLNKPSQAIISKLVYQYSQTLEDDLKTYLDNALTGSNWDKERKILLKIAKNKSKRLENLFNTIKASEDNYGFALDMCKIDVNFLDKVGQDLRNNPEFMHKVIEANPIAIRWVGRDLIENDEFVSKLLNSSNAAIIKKLVYKEFFGRSINRLIFKNALNVFLEEKKIPSSLIEKYRWQKDSELVLTICKIDEEYCGTMKNLSLAKDESLMLELYSTDRAIASKIMDPSLMENENFVINLIKKIKNDPSALVPILKQCADREKLKESHEIQMVIKTLPEEILLQVFTLEFKSFIKIVGMTPKREESIKNKIMKSTKNENERIKKLQECCDYIRDPDIREQEIYNLIQKSKDNYLLLTNIFNFCVENSEYKYVNNFIFHAIFNKNLKESINSLQNPNPDFYPLMDVIFNNSNSVKFIYNKYISKNEGKSYLLGVIIKKNIHLINSLDINGNNIIYNIIESDKEHRGSSSTMMNLILQDGRYIDLVAQELWDDSNFIKSLISIVNSDLHIKIFEKIKYNDLMKNKEFILDLIPKSNEVLNFAGENLFDDVDFLRSLEGKVQYTSFLKFIGKDARKNKEYMGELLQKLDRQNKNLIKDLFAEIKPSPYLISVILQLDVERINSLDINDKGVLSKIVNSAPEYWGNSSIMEKLILKNKQYIHLVAPKLWEDSGFVASVISILDNKSEHSLFSKFVSNSLKKDKQFMLVQISRNHELVIYSHKDLFNNVNFIKELDKFLPFSAFVDLIGDKVRNNREYMSDLLQRKSIKEFERALHGH